MIELRVGNRKHFVTRWVAQKLPPEAVRLGELWYGTTSIQYDGPDGRSIIAYEGKKVVGFFRFSVSKIYNSVRLEASGTWVARTHRRQGIARALWEKALKYYKVTNVSVPVTSNSGMELVRKLLVSHKDVEFRIYDSR